MNASKNECIVWKGYETLEIFSMEKSDSLIYVGGIITANHQQFPALRYKIKLTSEWDLIDLSIKSVDSDEILVMFHKTKDNKWYDKDVKHCPELDGCVGLDLPFTPSTLSIPILAGMTEQVANIRLAALHPSEFRLNAMEYHYQSAGELVTVNIIDSDHSMTMYKGSNSIFYDVTDRYETVYSKNNL